MKPRNTVGNLKLPPKIVSRFWDLRDFHGKQLSKDELMI